MRPSCQLAGRRSSEQQLSLTARQALVELGDRLRELLLARLVSRAARAAAASRCAPGEATRSAVRARGRHPCQPACALRRSCSRSSIRSARRDSASTSPSPASPILSIINIQAPITQCPLRSGTRVDRSTRSMTSRIPAMSRRSALDLFHPAVARVVHRARSPHRPDHNSSAGRRSRAASRRSILAPTGSGKTLAAFLWCLNRLMFAPAPPRPERCRVLYVSPLKALAVDVERNLRAPLDGIAGRRAGAGPGGDDARHRDPHRATRRRPSGRGSCARPPTSSSPPRNRCSCC